MKQFTRHIVFVLFALLTLSCAKKEENATPSVLTINPTSSEKESGVAHTLAFRVTCDKSFKAETDSDWATISNQSEGTNNVTTLTISLTANESEASRTCKLSISSGKKSIEASITQLSINELLTFSDIELFEMFPTKIGIKLPESWTLRCLDADGNVADWYSANASSGVKNVTKSVEFVASSLNTGAEARTGKAEISIGGVKLYIPVSQAATEMIGADLGVFNYDHAGSEIKYEPLEHQYSLVRGSSTDTFRIVDPDGNRFLVIEGLPKSYTDGQTISFELVQNWTSKMEFISSVSAKVLRQDDDFVWLLDGDVSYVIKK